MLQIILHLSTVMKVESALQKLIQDAVKNKSLPPKADWLPLLSSVEDLFTAGLIKIPGAEVSEVQAILAQLKSQISG